MKYLAGLATCVLLSCATLAEAKSGRSFDYFAFTVNNSSYDSLNFRPNISDQQIAPFKLKVTEPSMGYRAFYGYQYNPFFAIEGGVNYFAKSSFNLTQEEKDSKGTVTTTQLIGGEFSAIAADMRVIGTYAISNNVYLKANIGAVAWYGDKAQLTRTANKLVITSDTDSGLSPVAGFGIAFGYKQFVALSVDIEKTKVYDVDIENIGISATFRL